MNPPNECVNGNVSNYGGKGQSPYVLNTANLKVLARPGFQHRFLREFIYTAAAPPKSAPHHPMRAVDRELRLMQKPMRPLSHQMDGWMGVQAAEMHPQRGGTPKNRSSGNIDMASAVPGILGILPWGLFLSYF
ncbi:hypothetical protein EYZ11_008925 [Aspergillus tanneri]|uniref:Uncharacterized protein n=1 Tax=Aspergillus tanneri TaxID=1220188 RepID=A0A4S3J9D1_9EURO|nr:hypothetical protein EYZ11_008925 [Aspergillus tanneri]